MKWYNRRLVLLASLIALGILAWLTPYTINSNNSLIVPLDISPLLLVYGILGIWLLFLLLRAIFSNKWES
jgi:hypothetical protein